MSTERPAVSLTRTQTDGRIERRLRTQRAIVAAHVGLLEEGALRPTAATIAERAGVSVRTLWAAFGDMEGLLQATTAYWFEADDELRTNIDPTLSLAERIDLFCAERERRLEHLAPAARAAALMEVDSEALRVSRRGHVSRFLEDVESTFAPELDALSDRATALDAVVVATSWNAWTLLRDDLGRSAEESRGAMVRAVSAALES